VIRIGAYGRPDDRYVRFLVQHGVRDVVLSEDSLPDHERRFAADQVDTPDAHWDLHGTTLARQRCEDVGLRVVAVENPHPTVCFDQIILGRPGRER
jgi:hypothetical protein